ncbi:MAG: phosphoribosylglycinamide formyltransferase [Saprospiraceae bacterium]
MLQVAIFASGTGTNAKRIIESSRSEIKPYHISLLVCNNPVAGIMSVAIDHKIPVLIVNRETFFDTESILPQLREFGIDYIILAGYIWKLPSTLIDAYRGRIVNIHPALLPKFGGKGMFGIHVHLAVKMAAESKTGITIHYVDEHYDAGDIIFQSSIAIESSDTPEDIQRRVQKLEHEHYPEIVDRLLREYALEHPKAPQN